jgi:flagellar biogenesis protein FliO
MDGLGISDYLFYLFALLFVLGLMGLAAWAMKKFNFVQNIKSTDAGMDHLSIDEIRPVDTQRRLILCRDGVDEHVILTGPHNDLHLASRPIDRGEDHAS